jgi:hypothetical protein
MRSCNLAPPKPGFSKPSLGSFVQRADESRCTHNHTPRKSVVIYLLLRDAPYDPVQIGVVSFPGVVCVQSVTSNVRASRPFEVLSVWYKWI